MNFYEQASFLTKGLYFQPLMSSHQLFFVSLIIHPWGVACCRLRVHLKGTNYGNISLQPATEKILMQ